MRKITTFLLISMLLLFSLSALVGCDGDQPVGPNDPGNIPVTTIHLVENGVSEYRIVIPDPAPKIVQAQAIALRRAIQAVSGASLQVVNDWENKDDHANIKEILVGNTNRAESLSAAEQLNGKDFAIVNSGNKLAIVAKTDEMIELAVASFLSDCLGYRSAEDFEPSSTISIPDNLNMSGSRNAVLYVANEQLSYVDAMKTALSGQLQNLVVASGATDPVTVFSSARSQLVIVAGIEAMGHDARSAMQTYLNNGGRVLLLGGPAFEKPYVWNGNCVTSDEYKSHVIEDMSDDEKQIVLDAASSSQLAKLGTISDGNSGVLNKKIGNYGLQGSLRQLLLEVENLAAWAAFQTDVSVSFKDANVISFYAKAGESRTNVVSLEIVDSTGARWRTKVPLADEWTHYTFSPSDFTYYQGGTKTNSPNFSDITKIKFSFEISYLKLAKGHHSCYISDVVVSCVKNDPAFVGFSATDDNLNGVAPLYEQYPITNAADISADAGQVFVSDRNYVIPTGENSLISRYSGITGAGYAKDTDIRFIPLLTVTDAKGLLSGYAAWIDLYATQTAANGDKEGAMVGYFGATTDEFYNADGIAAVVETAVAMTRNAFIVDAGTTEYTYLKDSTDTVTAGIKYVTLNDLNSKDLVASVALYQGDKLLAEYSSADAVALGFANSIQAIQGHYDLSKGTPDRAVATLRMGDQVIDRVEQDIHYWSPKPISERSYVYTEDGYFKKDGKIINFFGINYFPSYLGGAPENSQEKITSTYASFLSDGGYNPSVIESDLARLKDLGMNAVAIQTSVSSFENSYNLLDLLRICEQMGMYVDLSISSVAYPLKNYNAQTVEEMIRKLQLAEHDIIYAYDIAWEERVGTYDGKGGRYIGRQDWDDDFTAWVKVQYGSIDAAQAAWGTSVSLKDGKLVVTDDMLDDTTPKYSKLVAAYYRFIDDIVGMTMQENLSHLQSLAPDQLISFRMSMSGSTLRNFNSEAKPSTFCFDFQSLASSMAFMQPEGYHLAASEEACLQIMFANAYARYTQPDSPVVWKEFGKSVWASRDDGNFYQSEAAIAAGSEYYEYVLDYCLKSYTAGMFPWWSQSGYRANEDSDYGIFNPDGSDRGEITALIREYAPKFINQGERKNTVYIEIERDDFVGGLFGMFDAVKDDLAAAYKAGKSVTFIDKSQGTDGSYAYADTLLDEYVADAIADAGTAPLRYVNGIIKCVDVMEEGGKTYAQITVCNTKQSIWRAGTVSIVSTDASDIAVDHTITEQLDYLDNATVKFEINGSGTIALRFSINGVPFGPLYTAQIN